MLLYPTRLPIARRPSSLCAKSKKYSATGVETLLTQHVYEQIIVHSQVLVEKLLLFSFYIYNRMHQSISVSAACSFHTQYWTSLQCNGNTQWMYLLRNPWSGDTHASMMFNQKRGLANMFWTLFVTPTPIQNMKTRRYNRILLVAVTLMRNQMRKFFKMFWLEWQVNEMPVRVGIEKYLTSGDLTNMWSSLVTLTYTEKLNIHAMKKGMK